ncbi:MAG: DUF692 domain-containing protein [Saccharospirillaceae bacterium]|nr:DUF692 domain-containing protein [Pseudomonadales bacterium]NRB77969.1 DUF692 domain-containing protein [Saccharospirillaceae bacterium]
MTTSKLPTKSGIGLKPQHYEQILKQQPDIAWFEIHPENYFGNGGPAHHFLTKIAQDYPISMHGVGLSLGSANGLNKTHLKRLKKLVDRYQPAVFSEHLAWCENNNQYFNDLLPLPYNEESLEIFIKNVLDTQDTLKRSILIENPSIYIQTPNQMSEIEFLNELIKKTDCGLLLDINNVYVSAFNLGFNPQDYLDHFPTHAVQEIHLAGHSDKVLDKQPVKIDDHGSVVCNDVWQLYEHFINKHGAISTQIEWDSNTPELNIWLDEAKKSDFIINNTLNKKAVLC